MPKAVIGIALLVGGIVLLVMGIDASDSVASELNELVEDTPSDRSIVLIVSGAVAAVAGLGLLLVRGGGRA